VIAQKPLMVTPKLEQLPVYVRGGTILPIAPLTQSTAEVPNGPLTLRVYPSGADPCTGEVYTDDGHTFDFRNGAFARIHFTCAVAADGSLEVNVAKQEGNWKPWWHEYRVQVMGWSPKTKRATANGKTTAMTQLEGHWAVTVPANGEETKIGFE
jgi:alpha-glucosidase